VCDFCSQGFTGALKKSMSCCSSSFRGAYVSWEFLGGSGVAGFLKVVAYVFLLLNFIARIQYLIRYCLTGAKCVLREVCILRRLQHPNICALKDAFLRPSNTGWNQDKLAKYKLSSP
jgi:hypothetical protein